MRCGWLYLLCALLLVTQGVLAEVWEFGIDAPGSIIVDHRHGEFSLFQKTREIHLKVPYCYVVEYVRVKVHNTISNPTVKFNKLSNIVSITYKALQYSVSNYDIIAKAERKPGCFDHVMETQMRHPYG